MIIRLWMFYMQIELPKQEFHRNSNNKTPIWDNSENSNANIIICSWLAAALKNLFFLKW